MKRLLIFSGKGKSGKSALACSLAHTATIDYAEKVAIIDADPRRNISYWARIYKEQMGKDLVVEPGDISCVPRYLEEVQANRIPPDLVLIDTVLPFSMGSSKNFDLAVEAANAVNLVLIPCRPTLSDIWAIDAPVRAASESQTPALVVVSAVLGRNRWEKDAENYLSKRLKSYPNIEKMPIKLENYEAFVHLLAQGIASQVPDNSPQTEKATQEIIDLYQYVRERCTNT